MASDWCINPRSRTYGLRSAGLGSMYIVVINTIRSHVRCLPFEECSGVPFDATNTPAALCNTAQQRYATAKSFENPFQLHSTPGRGNLIGSAILVLLKQGDTSATTCFNAPAAVANSSNFTVSSAAFSA